MNDDNDNPFAPPKFHSEKPSAALNQRSRSPSVTELVLAGLFAFFVGSFVFAISCSGVLVVSVLLFPPLPFGRELGGWLVFVAILCSIFVALRTAWRLFTFLIR